MSPRSAEVTYLKKLIEDFSSEADPEDAGETRKSSDPGGGRIGFGGARHQQQRFKFKGTAPTKIDDELDIASSHLVLEPEDPIENAMRFYQQDGKWDILMSGIADIFSLSLRGM